MANINRYIQSETIVGEPVLTDDAIVTPVSRALFVKLPFAGFVWNRQVAVHVQRENGEETIPIIDITRMAQVGLFSASIMFAIITWLLSRRITR